MGTSKPEVAGSSPAGSTQHRRRSEAIMCTPHSSVECARPRRRAHQGTSHLKLPGVPGSGSADGDSNGPLSRQMLARQIRSERWGAPRATKDHSWSRGRVGGTNPPRDERIPALANPPTDGRGCPTALHPRRRAPGVCRRLLATSGVELRRPCSWIEPASVRGPGTGAGVLPVRATPRHHEAPR